MSVALYARIRALPGHADAVAALLSSLAEEVRREPGCLVFEPWFEAGVDGAFFVYELYADERAFARHLTAWHSVAFNDALREHAVGGRSDLTDLVGLG